MIVTVLSLTLATKVEDVLDVVAVILEEVTGTRKKLVVFWIWSSLKGPRRLLKSVS